MSKNQVVTFHDAAIFDHPEWFSTAFVKVYRAMWPRLARRCRRVVTVSQYSQARLAQALDIPQRQIEVVPNGVAERFTPPAADLLEGTAQKYGVEPGRYFVTLSTVEPRKNLKLVLDGWARSVGRRPAGMKLLLLGGAGAKHIFASSDTGAEDLPQDVSLSGFVPDADLPALLGGACALLYPSRYEGFGLPLVEAMACGTPAVTTRLTSLPEVGGDAVLYVDPDDAQALADFIVQLASERSLRDDLSLAGLERAKAFSWDNAARAMETILSRDLQL
ncbi:glycosyltransferase family 4 protein [Sphingomonas crocodyli]|uniref:Glycosyltransferase family 1 protein n=1 Tax=Sphingomonas crocodyli TaxID=1979270 RepID=A0A437LXR0_9SPHN|nr:glycosyltransferase family 1 protein [Sphingomonas crocodyli]RVT90144.1 glycosyltransferase family 1 protein [Sphingomonas crocodyli]